MFINAQTSVEGKEHDYQGCKTRRNMDDSYINLMPGVALLALLSARAGTVISVSVFHADIVHEARNHRPQIHREQCYVEERKRMRLWLPDHRKLHPACLGLYVCMRVRKMKTWFE